MRQQFFAEHPTKIQIPWLEPRNARMQAAGFALSFSELEVPADTGVYVDPASERARLLLPDGKVRSWKSLVEVKVTKEPGSWHVDWHSTSAGTDPSFGIYMGEDGYEVSIEAFEGREGDLFPEFVRLVTDEFHNPMGFAVPDGRYSSNMGVDFDVKFGRSGGRPSLVAVEETVSVQPEFPYETIIGFAQDTLIFDVADKKQRTVPAGAYSGRVKAWHGATGEVFSVKYEGQKARFALDGKQLIDLIHQGKLELLEIVQDRMPNY